MLNELEPLKNIQNLKSLTIEDNPICTGRANLRVNLLGILPQLEEINGRKVEPLELAAVTDLPTSGAGRGKTRRKQPPDEDLIGMVESLVLHACNVDDKIQAVHTHFEDAVREVISEAWNDVMALEAKPTVRSSEAVPWRPRESSKRTR